MGAAISEVGAVMMVGGNILGYTRNIPTAIALETTKGEFAQASAMAVVKMRMKAPETWECRNRLNMFCPET